ncbi:hypothetical protein MRS76_05860 [Rhizobiaceae bacterium n13]|uniref:Uncharacterized protein n=1 Tax=Ferirhizobium litorale TaxID=2927786 RepID=A0AAE3QDL8_9HYPH|nr:DUF6656 family protein [Fererhizobium litorale]MDI7861474.1 hypothetical protein [Fererhizobium litorale]MDI7921620.1 hypothetical protein [Fererhizobium litorale]
MSKLRYFDTGSQKPTDRIPVAAAHSEFLRTGRISRAKEHWLTRERRYLTYEEVAEKTGRKLQAAGEATHERLNAFHRAITFPKLIFHRTLEESPHLGYCHVTASRTSFKAAEGVSWAFYIANFYSDVGGEENFFTGIDRNYARMFFAVAMHPGDEAGKMTIDRSIRSSGLLFRTPDPKEAYKNVLMLGARSDELRRLVGKL